MKMTYKLAKQLMDSLGAIAITTIIDTTKKDPNSLTDEEIEFCNVYARRKFVDILTEWENLFNEKWEIEEE